MSKHIFKIVCILISITNYSFSQKEHNTISKLTTIHFLNNSLVDIVVNDRFSPPVAARIHAYCNLAYYEVFNHQNSIKSFTPILNNYTCNQHLQLSGKYPKDLYASVAFISIASELTFSTNSWEEIVHFMCENREDSIIYNSVLKEEEAWLKSYLIWIKEDGFKQRLSKEIYSLSNSYKDYQLTPPAYKPALESHWGELRTFIIKDKNKFSCKKQFEIDSTKNCSFYKMNSAIVIHQKNLDSNQTDIAFHWDCNPLQVKTFSHARLYNFRMTPASHWISICSNTIQKEQFDIAKSTYIYTCLSLAMNDAFISCWSDKYHYNSIRPISYINSYIDENWNSLIETPNFPEYPSGHSLISACAATILNHFLGKKYAFIDISQQKYGQSSRNYKSFLDAANEAGISRYYGGIHYLPSIQDGFKSGLKIGKEVCNKLKIIE